MDIKQKLLVKSRNKWYNWDTSGGFLAKAVAHSITTNCLFNWKRNCQVRDYCYIAIVQLPSLPGTSTSTN